MAESNPFGGDGGGPPPAPQGGGYGDAAYGDAAYGNSGGYGDAAYGDAAQSAATSAATDQGKQKLNSAYEEAHGDMEAQGGTHAPPPPPDWCARCMNWFPIRWFCVVAGLCYMVFPWVDMIMISFGFVEFFLYMYLFVSGIVVVFAEMPTFSFTRKPQLVIFYWVKILSRMWGRAWFYFVIGTLGLSFLERKNGETRATGFAGIYFFVLAFFSMFISWLAARKYQRMFIFVAAGTEGDALRVKLEQKFDELDASQEGMLSSVHIKELGSQAGRDLANAELHAIFTFLDVSCHGRVLKEDFVEIFMTHNLSQRFM